MRARNAEVAAVPAIPFSYFDPQTRTYVTVSSEPISLRVRPAATLSDTQIVGGNGGPAQTMTELEEVAGGILANYTGADLLLSSQAFAFTWGHGLVLAFGPLAFGVVAAGRHRARRMQRDGGHVRRRRARREALRRLAEASMSPDREANLAAAAVSEYVADRCNLPPGALTTTEVVERLADAGISPEVLEDVATLLGGCAQHRYAGRAGGAVHAVPQHARTCLGAPRRGAAWRIGAGHFGTPFEELEQALAHTLEGDDPWLRACVTFSLAEAGTEAVRARLPELARDADPLVRETARAVTAQDG